MKLGNIAWLLLSCTLILSCHKKAIESAEASQIETSSILIEKPSSSRDLLISPIRLNKGKTELVMNDFIVLEDYQNDPDPDITVTLNSSPDIPFKINDGRITIDSDKVPLDPISFLKIQIPDESIDIPLIRSEKISKTISYAPPQKVSTMAIAGAFNSWSAEPMTLNDGVYEYSSNFDPGTYPYQLVIDGKWRTDPDNIDSIPNGFGAYNSALNVSKNTSTSASRIWTESLSDNAVRFAMQNPSPTQYFVLWNNMLIDEWTSDLDENHNVTIPNQARANHRSHLRVYGCSEAGKTNDILIPLEYGKVIRDPSRLDRYDKHTQILYFMMIDRFFNGDTSIDEPIDDERVAYRANYQGGDLEGIYQKVNEGYFEELGVNTIWLSPITQNPLEAYQEYPEPRRYYSGYHGYWPTNNRKVDHRFGDDFTLKKLVARAHRDEMNVLLDFVSNHVHEDHMLYKRDTTIGTVFHLPDGRKNLRLWDGETRLTTWFDTFMPSIDLEREELSQMMADTALYWIDEFDLDGFRHDATKHIPLSYWRLLTQKLKAGVMKEKSIYQVGETFGNRELIGSYVGAGMLDGQFDFNLYFDARDILAKENTSFERLRTSLESTLGYYGHHSLMANLSGNHDLPRFIAYASEALSYDEDPKEAGWTREVKIKNPLGYNRLELLHAFNMTIPGIPVIYYGDEIGMVGANDPDNRRMMRFENLSESERALKENISQLTRQRRNSMSLLYGDIEILISEEHLLAYKRSFFEESTIVVLNKSPEARELIIPADLSDMLSDTYLKNYGKTLASGALELNIPAYDYEIIHRK